ncbi:hypothetical protein FRC01_009767, partial [Tulasnella sp. 417]
MATPTPQLREMAEDPRVQYFMQINNKAQGRLINFTVVLEDSGPQNQTQWTCQLAVTIPNFAQQQFVGSGSSRIRAKNAASRQALLWLEGFGI